MYREADDGGHFEYFPAIRSADDNNFDGVRTAIETDGAGAVRITTAPGTLAVFHGHHAMHRVTQQLFYGRIVRPE